MSEEKKGKQPKDEVARREGDEELEKSGSKAPDPMGQMLEFYDTFSKSWSSAMSDAVTSKSFAESMSKQMESGLDAMAFWRKQMGQAFEQYLQGISLPTHSQVADLAARLTSVEMALDDLDAKLDQLLDSIKEKGS